MLKSSRIRKNMYEDIPVPIQLPPFACGRGNFPDALLSTDNRIPHIAAHSLFRSNVKKTRWYFMKCFFHTNKNIIEKIEISEIF